MNAFDTLLALMPMITFISLMFTLKFGKSYIANLYLFVVIMLATVVLGLISLSIIQPFTLNISTPRNVLINVIAGTYILAMVYGGWGIKNNKAERVIVAGMFIFMISLVSLVI